VQGKRGCSPTQKTRLIFLNWRNKGESVRTGKGFFRRHFRAELMDENSGDGYD
jgi:hypothetical protein